MRCPKCGQRKRFYKQLLFLFKSRFECSLCGYSINIVSQINVIFEAIFDVFIYVSIFLIFFVNKVSPSTVALICALIALLFYIKLLGFNKKLNAAFLKEKNHGAGEKNHGAGGAPS